MADYRLFGNPSAPVCFLQPVDDHDLADMGAETDALRALCPGADWCIAAVPVGDWNQDLTPWSAPPVFGKTPFGDGAPRTLKRLLEEVIPALEAEHPAQRRYAVCGYSLAGLFALWAGCETDRFCGVAAASPSVWYPGWLDYAEAHPPRAAAVYLSLGDREERARNPVMATVGDAIRRQHALLTAQGVPAQLEWNPGNHFADSGLRTAKGMAWVMGKMGKG